MVHTSQPLGPWTTAIAAILSWIRDVVGELSYRSWSIVSRKLSLIIILPTMSSGAAGIISTIQNMSMYSNPATLFILQSDTKRSNVHQICRWIKNFFERQHLIKCFHCGSKSASVNSWATRLEPHHHFLLLSWFMLTIEYHRFSVNDPESSENSIDQGVENINRKVLLQQCETPKNL